MKETANVALDKGYKCINRKKEREKLRKKGKEGKKKDGRKEKKEAGRRKVLFWFPVLPF